MNSACLCMPLFICILLVQRIIGEVASYTIAIRPSPRTALRKPSRPFFVLKTLSCETGKSKVSAGAGKCGSVGFDCRRYKIMWPIAVLSIMSDNNCFVKFNRSRAFSMKRNKS